MRIGLATLAIAVATFIAPTAALAAWMGLADGDYAFSLACTPLNDPICSPAVTGTITVSGDGLSAMDVDIDGQTFMGDPVDGIFDGTLVDTENSTLINTPYSFFSLRLITDGSISSFVVGDLWWVYCVNTSTTTCTPTATGLWSPTRVGTVDEPPALAMIGLVLVFVASAMQRSRRQLRTMIKTNSPRRDRQG